MEGKDAAKVPTMCKAASYSQTYSIRSVHSAPTENPWFRSTATGLSHPMPFANVHQDRFDNGWIWTVKLGQCIGSTGSMCPSDSSGQSCLASPSFCAFPQAVFCPLALSHMPNPTHPCEPVQSHHLQEGIPGFSCWQSSLQRK